MMFEAVILMGGFGTRLKSLSNNIPKPMMPVGGMPFVYLLLKKLEGAGCKKIIFSLHYQANEIIKKIKKDIPVNCEYDFVIEDTPLGTGGALKLAADYVSENKFIAINGDTYTDLDYAKFYKDTVDYEFAIAGINVKNAERYGSIFYDENCILNGIKEKGFAGPAVINSGTYLISKSSISEVEEDIFSFEEVYIPKYFNKAKVLLFKGEFIDIGVPEDYYLACKYFQ